MIADRQPPVHGPASTAPSTSSKNRREEHGFSGKRACALVGWGAVVFFSTMATAETHNHSISKKYDTTLATSISTNMKAIFTLPNFEPATTTQQYAADTPVPFSFPKYFNPTHEVLSDKQKKRTQSSFTACLKQPT